MQVIRVDLERRQIDLGLSEILDAVRQSERNRGPRRSQVKPRREAPRPAGGAGAPAGDGRAAKVKSRRAQRPGPRERALKKAAGGKRRR